VIAQAAHAGQRTRALSAWSAWRASWKACLRVGHVIPQNIPGGQHVRACVSPQDAQAGSVPVRGVRKLAGRAGRERTRAWGA
jgi:hypothetical protein